MEEANVDPSQQCPCEIWHQIGWRCDEKSLCGLMSTCRASNEAFDDPYFWKQRFVREFSAKVELNSVAGYRTLWKGLHCAQRKFLGLQERLADRVSELQEAGHSGGELQRGARRWIDVESKKILDQHDLPNYFRTWVRSNKPKLQFSLGCFVPQMQVEKDKTAPVNLNKFSEPGRSTNLVFGDEALFDMAVYDTKERVGLSRRF